MNAAAPLTSCSSKLRVLMLASDAHGGRGGISQYNRDVLEALAMSKSIEEVLVIPRIPPEEKPCPPNKINYDWKSAGGKASYARRALSHGLLGKRFDLIYCAHINLMPLALLLSRARNVRVVLAVYGIDAWQPPRDRITGWAATKASTVVSISRLTLNRFLAWAGAEDKRSRILPNAIHLEKYRAAPKSRQLAKELGLGDGPVIMTLGRMSPEERYKGFDQVLEVMPRLLKTFPSLKYIVAGDGADRTRLERKARDLGVEHATIFTGRLEERRKADYFRLADAYVMPSSGEGFGFVVLEALACGIPVVVSKTDGTYEAILEGELGLAVNPTDPLELADQILTAVRQPKGVPERLAHFSFSNFAHRLEETVAAVTRQ